jgi:hypothetical protein
MKNTLFALVAKVSAGILGLAFLIGCEDKSLVSRKSHCEYYAKQGLIESSKLDACMHDKDTYTKAALSYSGMLAEIIYPKFIEAKSSLDENFSQFDKTDFAPLTANAELPIMLDESDKTKIWRYFFTLERAWFWAPSLADEQTGWSISGDRSSSKNFGSISLDGVAPNSLEGLEDSCSFVSSSKNSKGCVAEVYIDISNKNEVLPKLIVLGVQFYPPSKSEALTAIFEAEMLGWEPVKTK